MVKKKTRSLTILLAPLVLGGLAVLAGPLSTVFTYQGQLRQAGNLAQGNHDFRFTLFDAETGGQAVGPTVTNLAVSVQAGLFTVVLDFGAGSFTGEARWLEVGVRGGTNLFSILAPRQAVTLVPYTQFAVMAAGVPGSNVVGIIPDTHLSSNVALLDAGRRLSEGLLPASVALLNGNQTFTGANTFTSNVGIGTSTPTTALDVAGTVTAAAFRGNGLLTWQAAASLTVTTAPNTSYLATNSELTIFQLPSAPGFGEVVRIAGLGAGGWRVAQNDGQSILTKKLGVALAGRAWTPLETVRDWRGIASSASGSRLVAAAAGDSIYTSTNAGATWTPRESPRDWRAVASSADGTNLVALVANGLIYTSTSAGSNWSARAVVRDWKAVASSADGVRLAAVAGGYGFVYVSTNSGVAWNASPLYAAWSAVASSLDGTKLVAVQQVGQIFTSSDAGVTWTAHDNARAWSAVAAAADGIRLVAAVSGGSLYTSTNSGTTWNSRETNRTWTAVASSADGTHLVAAAQGDQLFVSHDAGITWTGAESSRDWKMVASSADATQFVAVAAGGQIYVSIPTTTLGAEGGMVGSADGEIELQFIGNGRWAIRSYAGTLTVY